MNSADFISKRSVLDVQFYDQFNVCHVQCVHLSDCLLCPCAVKLSPMSTLEIPHVARTSKKFKKLTWNEVLLWIFSSSGRMGGGVTVGPHT